MNGPVAPAPGAAGELLDEVVEADIACALGRAVTKDQALSALRARAELVERLLRHRWLAMEAATAAGATWSEVADATGVTPAGARAEYEAVLGRQRRFGLVDPRRADPVNGHDEFPTGGHQKSPRTATRSSRGRPLSLPRDGHENSPRTATVRPQVRQASGTTPLPARASSRRMDWPSVTTT